MWWPLRGPVNLARLTAGKDWGLSFSELVGLASDKHVSRLILERPFSLLPFVTLSAVPG